MSASFHPSIWLASLILLTACAATTANEWRAKWGGPIHLYEPIFTETSCRDLEAAIAAEASRMGNRRAVDHPWTSAVYIQATFRRMVDLGCPEAFQ